MSRNSDEVLEGLKLEYEQANAAPSASIGMTPLQQTGAGNISNTEELSDELTHLEPLENDQYQRHSLQ
ncbi:MAG: hypothetical protein K0R57_830 [Paenibacillaceae bacterium]|jgi:hypothetical protein|nr:hypothetical protein [Paenibacillaceae bacterium]